MNEVAFIALGAPVKAGPLPGHCAAANKANKKYRIRFKKREQQLKPTPEAPESDLRHRMKNNLD
ncbi:hypothetical protein [Gallaecimonas pentaromativorans]|uniref:hypothetical protein n=1 Tax=Gallaecimonas pentaromativorans TaxID=584787 RepID=UPI003A8D9CDF